MRRGKHVFVAAPPVPFAHRGKPAGKRLYEVVEAIKKVFREHDELAWAPKKLGSPSVVRPLIGSGSASFGADLSELHMLQDYRFQRKLLSGSGYDHAADAWAGVLLPLCRAMEAEILTRPVQGMR